MVISSCQIAPHATFFGMNCIEQASSGDQAIWASFGCGLFSSSTGPASPSGAAGKNESPNLCPGSIINVDNRSVSESVLIVGTPFHLIYDSSRSLARTYNYSISVPITGSVVPTNVSSISVSIVVAGRTISATYANPAPNITYNFVWDGLDSIGNTVVGTKLASIKINTVYKDGTLDFPPTIFAQLGIHSSLSYGHGGWELDVHHFYDSGTNTVLLGDGSVRRLTVSPVTVGATLQIPAKDGSEVYVFDKSGNHLKTLYGLTGATKYAFSYDSVGGLTSVSDAFGNTTTFVKTSGGILASILAPYGQKSIVSVNASGWLTSFQNPNFETVKVTYCNSAGLIETFQKPRGQLSTFIFDPQGLLMKDSSSNGVSTTLSLGPASRIFAHDKQSPMVDQEAPLANSNMHSVTVPIGNSYVTLGGLFDEFPSPLGQKLISTSAEGRTGIYEFGQNNNGFQRSTTRPDGSSSDLNYKNLGSLTNFSSEGTLSYNTKTDPRFGDLAQYGNSWSLTLPSGSVSTATNIVQTYVANNSPPSSLFDISSLSSTSSTNGNITTSTYTGLTRKTEIISPMGRVSSQTVDATQRITSSLLNGLSATSIAYDTRGHLSKLTQGTRTATFGYDTLGRLNSIKNALNQATTFAYDLAGRVTQMTFPDARFVKYAYDSNGTLVSITPPGKSAHAFIINAKDLPSSYAPPALGAGNVTTQYSYNNDKQLTQVQRPDGLLVKFNYDTTTNHLLGLTLPIGSYVYTWSLNHIASANSPDSIQNNVVYDGNFVSSDKLLAPTSGMSLGGIAFTRNSDFNIATETVKGFSATNASAISYTYDKDTLMTAVGSETKTLSPINGLPTSTAIGLNTETIGYDNFGSLTNYDVKQGATLLYSSTLTRDAIGRVATKAEIIGGILTNYGYTYDPAGRLSAITKNAVAPGFRKDVV